MKTRELIPFATLPSTAFMMAAVAGFSDVMGFVGANKLFTAHITGNIVIAISDVIHHEPGLSSKIISLPLFIVIVMFVTTFTEIRGQSRNLLAMWLFFEALFLTGFMFAGIYILNYDSVSSVLYTCGALLAVCAMAIHNVLLRTFMATFPPCTVMTGNLTQIIVDTVGYGWGWKASYPVESRTASHAGIRRFGNALIGFLVGGGLAAVGYTLFSFWSVAIPILLLLYMTIKSLK